MTHLVKFTRTFTRGNLVGLDHQDSISFPTRDSAESWLAAVTKAGAAGRLDYTISAATIVAA